MVCVTIFKRNCEIKHSGVGVRDRKDENYTALLFYSIELILAGSESVVFRFNVIHKSDML